MKNLLIVIGITLVLALLACATKEVVVQKEVDSFSVDKLRNLTLHDVENRFKLFEQLTQFNFLSQNESIPWRTHTNQS